jgi:putative ABC transport system ATP-binding protein
MNQLVFASQITASGRTALIVARDLGRRSRACDSHWTLRGLDLEVPAGAFVGLVGPPGSGKSALIRLLAGLERPSTGRLTVCGTCLNELDETESSRFRATALSVVFPSQNLLSNLTLCENLELPLLLTSLRRTERRERAESALELVGLGSRRARYPHELPPVDQQRAAIARSLLNGANLIVADEPCRLLAPHEHNRVLDLLSQLNSVFRKTIVLATRDESVSGRLSLLHRLSPQPGGTVSELCPRAHADIARQPLLTALSA